MASYDVASSMHQSLESGALRVELTAARAERATAVGRLGAALRVALATGLDAVEEAEAET
jgi:hypothetical protein